MLTTRRSWLTAMWVAASGLVVLGMGCKKGDIETADKYGGPSHPEPPKYGGPPPSVGLPVAPNTGWRPVAAAALALAPNAIDDVTRQLAALDADRSAEVVAVLDAMAAQPPTAEGLEAASKLGHDAHPNVDPKWTGSGMAPNVAALHAGGMAVLHGLVAKGCANAKQKGTAKDSALALVKAFRRMPLPRQYDSGGLTDGRADRRSLMQEVQKNLDEGDWNAVALDARAWPSVPNPP